MDKSKISFMIVIIFFAICASTSLCLAGAKKPPPEETGEKGYIDWETFDAKMEDPAEFYARPEDLNDDGVIDERDRFLWLKQKQDELVVE